MKLSLVISHVKNNVKSRLEKAFQSPDDARIEKVFKEMEKAEKVFLDARAAFGHIVSDKNSTPAEVKKARDLFDKTENDYSKKCVNYRYLLTLLD